MNGPRSRDAEARSLWRGRVALLALAAKSPTTTLSDEDALYLETLGLAVLYESGHEDMILSAITDLGSTIAAILTAQPEREGA